MPLVCRSSILTLAVLISAASLDAQRLTPSEVQPPPGPPPLALPDESGQRKVLDEKQLQMLREEFEKRRLAQQKPPDDGFEPISELPPDERLPAAPMLVAAYAFVALALFAYLLSLGRRLGAVKQEMARLEGDIKRSGRP